MQTPIESLTSDTAIVETRTHRFSLSWAAATHVGHRRELNEDAFLAEAPVFAVADGMGGHDAGEVASSAAIDALRSIEARGGVSIDAVCAAISAANDDIHDEGTEAGASRGTTLVGVAITDETDAVVTCFNIGDSRCYLYEGALTQVSTDHSYVQELFEAGRISADEARSHPQRNVVTRAVGIARPVEVDIVAVPAEAGQRWLLCSDGLTDELDDEALTAHLGADSPSDAIEALSEATLAGAARDNITVVVLDIESVGPITPASDDDATDPRPSAAATANGPELITGAPGVDGSSEVTRPVDVIDGVPPGLGDGSDAVASEETGDEQ